MKRTLTSYPPLFVASLNTNILIIKGDMNAQIDKNKNNKFNLHSSSNRNREHQINFSQENGSTCLNTKFQKRRGKLWTYTYTNKDKAQIDYILMNKKWINNALNCEAYSSFEGVSSDHHIITANIWLSLCRNTTQTTKTAHYDWSLFNNKDISDKYAITLRNKYNAPQNRSGTLTLNDKYENYINVPLRVNTNQTKNKT